MALPVLPRAQAPIAGQLPTTIEWYNFFRDLRAFVIDNEGDVSQIDDILARLAALEAAEGGEAATIQGPLSVAVFGSLESGNVTVQLLNDADAPGATYYYGTGPDGVKGWYALLLSNLGDVDLTVPPTDGQALIYDAGSSTWIAGDVAVEQVFNRIDANGDIRVAADGSLRITN